MAKKIKICGTILDNDTAQVYGFLGMDCTSPDDVENILNDDDTDTDTGSDIDTNTGSDDNDNPNDVVVDINSGGGDVYAGSQIYTALRAYSKGKVTVNITGLAASAASVIAMAGDQVNMSPTSQLMIHKAWSVQQGNADTMKHEGDVLDSVDQSIVNAYIDKTGMKKDDLLKLMSDETWMSAQEAVNKGFADSVMFHNDDDDDTDTDSGDDDTDDTEDAWQIAASMQSLPSRAAVKKFIMLLHADDLKDKQAQPQHNQTLKKPTDSVSLYQKKLALLLNK